MPSIVQFMHPGPEHGHDVNNLIFKSWNHRDHKRKFLISKGSYVSERNLKPKGENLAFWGEWEPSSSVVQLNNGGNPLLPQWLHSRILPVIIPQNFGGLQNTDPYVFDGPFKYFTCRQSKNMNPTVLANLDDGSLILFGSYGHEKNVEFFQLDTVFVVQTSIQYDASNNNLVLFLQHTSQEYYDISYLRAFPNIHFYSLNLRLYKGVKFYDKDKDKNNGMYSFVPSQVYDDSGQGFSRVKIKSDSLPPIFRPLITYNLKLGFNANPDSVFDIAFIRRFWDEIVKISRANQCVEGIEFN